jgi:hypothetical protein
MKPILARWNPSSQQKLWVCALVASLISARETKGVPKEEKRNVIDWPAPGYDWISTRAACKNEQIQRKKMKTNLCLRGKKLLPLLETFPVCAT